MYLNDDTTTIAIIFRRKGKTETIEKFNGPVYVLEMEPGQTLASAGENLKLVKIDRSEIGTQLDLSRIPVIKIGGKKKHQGSKLRGFRAENPDFQGAFIMLPGSGGWDLDSGEVVLTSRELLKAGVQISGGKPVEEWINYRFSEGGAYVADWALTLHGKILNIEQSEVEQDATPELVWDWISGYGSRNHPLRLLIDKLRKEIEELEKARVLTEGGKERSVWDILQTYTLTKFKELGIKRVSGIPENFQLTLELVEPELASGKGMLGIIDIPGVGKKVMSNKAEGDSKVNGDVRAAVVLTAEEIRKVTDWPFEDIALRVAGAKDFTWHWTKTIFKSGEGRWPQILQEANEMYIHSQNLQNFPSSIKIADCQKHDAPKMPEPIIWGHDLITGKAKIAWPYLNHHHIQGWQISWTWESAEEAGKRGAEARDEAETFAYTRKVLANSVGQAGGAALPKDWPIFEPFKISFEEIMAKLEVTNYQLRNVEPRKEVRLEGGYFSEIREQWRGGTQVVEYHWSGEENGVIVIATIGLTNRILLDVCKKYASEEKVLELGVWIYNQEIARIAEYKQSLQEFLEAIINDPAYDYLPESIHEKCTEYLETLPSPENDLSYFKGLLETHWSIAVGQEWAASENELLVNWGGGFRMRGKSGRCNYWVIARDGSLRRPTQIEGYKHTMAEGIKYWRVIGPEELALAWDQYDGALVANMPKVLTQAQLKTVSEIEASLDLESGSFGLGVAISVASPEFKEVKEEEIHSEIKELVFEATDRKKGWYRCTKCKGQEQLKDEGELKLRSQLKAGKELHVVCPHCKIPGKIEAL